MAGVSETLEDLNLPNSVIARLIKDSIPSGVIVSKDARVAICRAASIFIMYATASACNQATKHNRKVISGQDVIDAMDAMEFGEFKAVLVEFLENFHKKQQEKKETAAKKRKVRNSAKKGAGNENQEAD